MIFLWHSVSKVDYTCTSNEVDNILLFCFILQQGIPDDCDEFGEFRIRVADLIKDCVFIVGSGNCFSQVGQLRQSI